MLFQPLSRRKPGFGALLSLALFSFYAAASLPAATSGSPTWILVTQPGDLSGVLSRHQLALHQVIRTGVYQVTSLPGTSTTQFAGNVSKDTKVSGFETDSEVRTPEVAPTPASPPSLSQLKPALADRSIITYYGARVRGAYANQVAAKTVEILTALSRFGAGNTTVAVIDTGVDPSHPALKNSLVSGYDFIRNVAGSASEMADLNQSTVAILDQSTVAILDSKIMPMVLNQSTVAILDQSTVAILDATKLPGDFGHGTMVAGLIHLVAPGVRIMPLKAFNSDGSSNLSDIIRAIYYAVDHQAKVINMSFSTTSPSPQLEAAIAYAKAHNVICVASAGNDGKKELVYPAAYTGAIGVGSVNPGDLRSVFSNYGVPSAMTSAPGEALVTTYPGGNYAGVWGSSFSSALVSGTAALMAQLNPRISGSTAMRALNHGKQINQGMGDARLDVLLSLLYSVLNAND